MMQAGSLDGPKHLGPDVRKYVVVSNEKLDVSKGLFGATSTFIRVRGAFIPDKNSVMTVAEREAEIVEATSVSDMPGADVVDAVDEEITEVYRIGWDVHRAQGDMIGRSNCYYRYERRGASVATFYGTLGGAETIGVSTHFGDDDGAAGVRHQSTRPSAPSPPPDVSRQSLPD
jgi:hypothetical protein